MTTVIIISIITVFFFIRTVLMAYRGSNILSKIITIRDMENIRPQETVHVLVPIYNENEIIDDLHKVYSRLAQNAPQNTSIYLVTSEARELFEGHYPTSLSLLKEKSNPGNLFLIDVGAIIKSKGELLNAALKIIKPNEDSWIGIYDADSNPESQVFCYASSVFKAHEVFQQPCVYLNNCQSLSATLSVAALHQTCWSMGVESYRYHLHNRRISMKLSSFLLPYIYPVTHGFYISMKDLSNISGFPDRYEDLRLGIPLSIRSFRIQTLPYFDRVDFANTVVDWIWQSANWTYGSWYVMIDYLNLMHYAQGRNFILLTVLTAKGIISNIFWCLEGLVFPLLIIGLLASGHFVSALVSLVLYLGILELFRRKVRQFLLQLLSLDRTVETYPERINLFLIILDSIIRSIGPSIATVCAFLLPLFRYKFTNRRTPKKKTWSR